MTLPCVEPPLDRPRDPRASDLWRLMDRHFGTFQRVYDERFAAKYSFWRPIIERSVTAELPELDMDRLHAAWQEAMFALFYADRRHDGSTRFGVVEIRGGARLREPA